MDEHDKRAAELIPMTADDDGTLHYKVLGVAYTTAAHGVRVVEQLRVDIAAELRRVERETQEADIATAEAVRVKLMAIADDASVPHDGQADAWSEANGAENVKNAIRHRVTESG